MFFCAGGYIRERGLPRMEDFGEFELGWCRLGHLVREPGSKV